MAEQGTEPANVTATAAAAVSGPDFVKIGCSDAHCVGLTRAGEAFTWLTGLHGNRFGQLGLGFRGGPSSSSTTTRTATRDAATAAGGVPLLTPQRVDLPNGRAVKDVDAGGSKDAGHTAFVDDQGGLWTCGCDRWTQLGHDGTSGWKDGGAWRVVPTQVTVPGNAAVTHVACGADHTAAIVQNGGVVGFGRGHKGQLTGGTRGPGTVKPSFSWALSKAQPTAVHAHGDCTCINKAPGGKKAPSNVATSLLGGGRGRAFGDQKAQQCFGHCTEQVIKIMVDMANMNKERAAAAQST